MAAPLNTPEQVAAAEAEVDRLLGADSGAPQCVREMCRDYRAAWVVEAAAVMAKKGRWSARYWLGILKNYAAQGGSDADLRERDGLKPVRGQGAPAAVAYSSPPPFKASDEERAYYAALAARRPVSPRILRAGAVS